MVGINLADVHYSSSTAPFANLMVGSDWFDSGWRMLSKDRLDGQGNLLSVPPDGMVKRFIVAPPTDAAGIDIRCSFTGAGSLSVWGLGGPIERSAHGLRFRLINEHGKQPFPWIEVTGFDPHAPLRDLDCREARLDRAVRWRPEFFGKLRGFGVVRFMDWQNANANEAVAWRDRHTPAALNLDRDGVSVEDMLAVAGELGADPWFVMPWNADRNYIEQFARLVRSRLPADRSVYVEVGNEVWNNGFAVGRQAVAEGRARKLGDTDMEAGLRRYGQRTVEVMSIWEAVFAGRRGLVRVLGGQHVWPATGETALAFGDTASHVDALATAPYFGTTLGGTANTRETSLQRLETELVATDQAVVANRRIATRYGKRYIAYEGGVGLALPAQAPLTEQLQHDPAMVDLITRYLAAWRRDSGDVLCLFNSVSRPSGWGMWGLAEWEDESDAQAPKLAAVKRFMAERRGDGRPPP
ncbi:hypothetical protein [Sphingomonas bacterium]|uniref:hypothetical protein n=1 Tax=Sphingomonas bacterium TaxID=1895847 RepID=UPI0015754F73|nr:hypothetical protein [Sphingomonas bacterium]